MLDVLHRVEAMLPDLLADRAGWSSKLIDYTPPVVWRLYRDVDIDGVGHRVMLHRIFPCERAFYHPHPWPSAIRVLPVPGSTYEMAVGSTLLDGSPTPYAAVIRACSGLEYAMTDPSGRHYVKVIGEPSQSVMVTGPVWEDAPKAPRTANYPFRALSTAEADVVFDFVCERYPAVI